MNLGSLNDLIKKVIKKKQLLNEFILAELCLRVTFYQIPDAQSTTVYSQQKSNSQGHKTLKHTYKLDG